MRWNAVEWGVVRCVAVQWGAVVRVFCLFDLSKEL
jgi:hypothetical protein